MLLFLNKKKSVKNAILGLLFGFLLLIPSYFVEATSVNRNALVNLDGKPGQIIKVEIVLEGTDEGERSGYWYSHYKKIDGDSDKMDITSWITINPKDFSIKQGEKKPFTVSIKVPRNSEPGLWGATSKEAGQEGHSGERRTYIVFKDALSEGNVYSGLLLPVSVKVSENTSLLAVAQNFVLTNIVVVILLVIIVVMVVINLFGKFGKKKKYTIVR